LRSIVPQLLIVQILKKIMLDDGVVHRLLDCHGHLYNAGVSTVLLAILSFAGYSTGAVVARRSLRLRAGASVPAAEVLVVAAGLYTVFFLRPAPLALKYFVLSAAAMGLLGTVVASASRLTKSRFSGGTREFEEVRPSLEPSSVWKRWLAFSSSIAEYEIRIVLVASYLFLIAPIAITSRLFRPNPARGSATSSWAPRVDSPGLDAARRPF
jgi:hypothetical protein